MGSLPEGFAMPKTDFPPPHHRAVAPEKEQEDNTRQESRDTRIFDPLTDDRWKWWQDTNGGVRYVREKSGLPLTREKLTRLRAKGLGPKWRFFGQKPMTTLEELDNYIENEALQDVSPLRRHSAGQRTKAPRQEAARRPAAKVDS